MGSIKTYNTKDPTRLSARTDLTPYPRPEVCDGCSRWLSVRSQESTLSACSCSNRFLESLEWRVLAQWKGSGMFYEDEMEDESSSKQNATLPAPNFVYFLTAFPFRVRRHTL